MSALIYRHEAFSLLNTFDMYLTIEISEDKEKETTWASKVILQFEDSKIKLEFNKNKNVSGFTVNSLNVLELGNRYVCSVFNSRSILPVINEIRQSNDPESDLASSLFGASLIIPISHIFRIRPFTKIFQTLVEKTKLNLHYSTTPENILKTILAFGLGSSEKMLKNIQEINSGQTWQKKTKKWTIETKEFQDLRNLIIANLVPFLMEKCDEVLVNFSKQVSYIGPLRATAERYYRIQDLAVDEVDYQGRNLTMFLHNLTPKQREEFASWTLLHFGFRASIEASLGHISLKIYTEESNKILNIADTGFGFSQILPIITQLWFLSSSSKPHQRILGTVTYAIEQPELHLHPRLQGNLTDALIASIKVAKNNNINLRLVIETHSEVLVNRLGTLVAEGEISPNEISIVLFEPSDKSKEITIRNSHFDSDGYLVDWPLGFFDMDIV